MVLSLVYFGPGCSRYHHNNLLLLILFYSELEQGGGRGFSAVFYSLALCMIVPSPDQ